MKGTTTIALKRSMSLPIMKYEGKELREDQRSDKERDYRRLEIKKLKNPYLIQDRRSLK